MLAFATANVLSTHAQIRRSLLKGHFKALIVIAIITLVCCMVSKSKSNLLR